MHPQSLLAPRTVCHSLAMPPHKIMCIEVETYEVCLKSNGKTFIAKKSITFYDKFKIRNNKLDQLQGMSVKMAAKTYTGIEVAAILKRRTVLDRSATAALC